jgi:hypothetical protein
VYWLSPLDRGQPPLFWRERKTWIFESEDALGNGRESRQCLPRQVLANLLPRITHCRERVNVPCLSQWRISALTPCRRQARNFFVWLAGKLGEYLTISWTLVVPRACTKDRDELVYLGWLCPGRSRRTHYSKPSLEGGDAPSGFPR